MIKRKQLKVKFRLSNQRAGFCPRIIRRCLIAWMWQFLAKNKQVAAMLGLLAVAALVVIFLSTRGSNNTIVKADAEETKDVSEDPHIFSTHK